MGRTFVKASRRAKAHIKNMEFEKEIYALLGF